VNRDRSLGYLGLDILGRVRANLSETATTQTSKEDL